MTKPKFKVGQVVRINTDFYKRKHKTEQYQRILKVWPWGKGFGYSLVGDEAHENYLESLSSRERGSR